MASATDAHVLAEAPPRGEGGIPIHLLSTQTFPRLPRWCGSRQAIELRSISASSGSSHFVVALRRLRSRIPPSAHSYCVAVSLLSLATIDLRLRELVCWEDDDSQLKVRREVLLCCLAVGTTFALRLHFDGSRICVTTAKSWL